MKSPSYPFSAVVGQDTMKLALLLAAVDWRISVLLRGDKGAGKTTTARGLAILLPEPAPFVNLPIGATEDRLLGGLHMERALKGDPVLKPGLLSEAHGGVLYVDEINLLAAHLGDALLDTAASGVNVIEREGLSATHPAEFVLLGSMNPEEGLLRPQLLDRFALAVDITASLDPGERQTVVERRIAFERNPMQFSQDWSEQQQHFKDQIAKARESLADITCSSEILAQVSMAICENGVRSLRADLSAIRASVAYAALVGDSEVQPHHVAAILPLVLAHRARDGGRPPVPPPQQPQSPSSSETASQDTAESIERIFAPIPVKTPAVRAVFTPASVRGNSTPATVQSSGSVIGDRRTENPKELDLRATLNHALIETGAMQPRAVDLHERVRESKTGTRYLFVIDSSGSHAAQERMRLVKGATSGVLERSFKNGDEVAIIVFRGTSAQMLLEPSRTLNDAITALEYLPTGGRTPLAHALDLARSYINLTTVLVLVTDGRANVALGPGNAWEEALEIARQINAPALVVDTEGGTQLLGNSRHLAEALCAEYVSLDHFVNCSDFVLSLQRTKVTSQL